ncbi:MAG TPA: hypothetical protein VGJ10_12860 [Paraburkholderia sp.]|jgi:glutamate transport system permease protein
MSRPNTLYEAPGPVGRMRQRIVSVVSALGVCALLAAIGIRLEASGQFEADKWAIFFHWGTAKFLFDGLMSTIEAAACAALVAFAMAFPLALGRSACGRIRRCCISCCRRRCAACCRR